jgi:hypothetical protein
MGERRLPRDGEVGLPRTEETGAAQDEHGIETLEYSARWAPSRIPVTGTKYAALLGQLIGEANDQRRDDAA